MATMTIIHDARGVKSQQGRGPGAAGQSAGGLTPLFPRVYLFNHKRAICAGPGVQHAPMLLAIRRGELSDKKPRTLGQVPAAVARQLEAAVARRRAAIIAEKLAKDPTRSRGASDTAAAAATSARTLLDISSCRAQSPALCAAGV